MNLDLDTSTLSDGEVTIYFKRTAAARHLRNILDWRESMPMEWMQRFYALTPLTLAKHSTAYFKAFRLLDERYANRNRPDPVLLEQLYWLRHPSARPKTTKQKKAA